MSPKPFIVFIALSLLAMLAYYCYLIGTVFYEFPRMLQFGCNDTLFEAYKEDRTNPIIYWLLLLVNLLFTHSMVKFAWNLRVLFD